jgi:hypothetical protein
MKIPFILILNILFLLILSSCRKVEIEEITSTVFAGIYNDSMLYHEFNPPWQITLQTDTLKNIQYGIDSIDIDLNGSFDIFIIQRIYLDWTDDFNWTSLEEDNFPYNGLRFKNNFEVAYRKIPVNVGKGEINNIPMVDTLAYESRIDRLKNWHDSKMDNNSYMGFYNGSIWLWGAAPSLFWNYGIWYSITNKYIYIGIRKNTDTGYKLGWIKVKVYSRDKFEIMSYAIEE